MLTTSGITRTHARQGTTRTSPVSLSANAASQAHFLSTTPLPIALVLRSGTVSTRRVLLNWCVAPVTILQTGVGNLAWNAHKGVTRGMKLALRVRIVKLDMHKAIWAQRSATRVGMACILMDQHCETAKSARGQLTRLGMAPIASASIALLQPHILDLHSLFNVFSSLASYRSPFVLLFGCGLSLLHVSKDFAVESAGGANACVDSAMVTRSLQRQITQIY